MTREEDILQVRWASICDNQTVDWDGLIIKVPQVIKSWFLGIEMNDSMRDRFPIVAIEDCAST